jgi:predicted nucleic acid-binding protein
MIILDTNVISELMNKTPEARVRAWADRQRPGQLLTTAVTVLELRAGAEELEDGRRRRQLEIDIEWALDELIGGRILRFDRQAAYATAAWQALCEGIGRPASTLDAQIAGIAISRGIPLPTRDVGGFEDISLKLINPWNASVLCSPASSHPAPGRGATLA